MRLIFVSILKIIEILQKFDGLEKGLEKRAGNIMEWKLLGNRLHPPLPKTYRISSYRKVDWKLPLELSTSFLPYRDLLKSLFSLSL